MSQTITQILLAGRSRPNTKLGALAYCRHKEWIHLSWSDYVQTIEAAAAGLSNLGITRQDSVCIMSNTRWEWACLDFAIMGLGAITVPIYQSSRPEDIEFIINQVEAKTLILENRDLLRRWNSLAPRCSTVKNIICLESWSELPDDILSWDDLLEEGTDLLEAKANLFVQAVAKNTAEDIATIVYTSGTTGLPKGVVMTHKQIMSEVLDIADAANLTSADVGLSFLPYAHVLGRVEIWMHAYVGHHLAFAESLERLSSNLKKIKPTMFIGVPRIFEKMYDGIMAHADANPVSKHLFTWALGVGRQVSRLRQQGQTLPMTLLPQYMLAKKLVFNNIREQFGGKIRFAISGSAPLGHELAEFFHAADILVLEGYGLTETTAAITVNTPFAFQFGTVGKPLKDVQIKIAADGEILVKSAKVFREYYKNPGATEEVWLDDYFATGDIGELTTEGFLRITDRKKDLIKTAGGKFVAPQKLENLLKMSKYISNALIHGDQRKYIVALITLNEPIVTDYARSLEISYQDFATLSQLPQVRELVRQVVADVNSKLASYETIKNFAILPHDFSLTAGELTPSLKIKRKVCDEKYRSTLDRLYGSA